MTNAMTRAPLTPPPHICGSLSGHDTAAHADRARWINAQHPSWTAYQIGRALGISSEAVCHAAPDRGQAARGTQTVCRYVSLPQTPFALDVKHEETAPRRGVMAPASMDHVSSVIAAIRDEHRRYISQREGA